MSSLVPGKEHLRHVLLLLFNLNKKAVESHHLLTETFGKKAPSVRTCETWFRKFRSGDFNVKDSGRAGRPQKCEEEQLQELLDENPTQTQRQLAESLDVSQETISRHLRTMGKIRIEFLQKNWIKLMHKPEKETNVDNLKGEEIQTAEKTTVIKDVKPKTATKRGRAKAQENSESVEETIAEKKTKIQQVKRTPKNGLTDKIEKDKSASAESTVSKKTSRGAKSKKSEQNGVVNEEPRNEVVAPTKGRKRKIADASENSNIESTTDPKVENVVVSQDLKPKAATKRGRTKKEVIGEPDPDTIAEKKTKVEAAEPVKNKQRVKKTPKDAVTDKIENASVEKIKAETTKIKKVGKKGVEIDAEVSAKTEKDIQEPVTSKKAPTRKRNAAKRDDSATKENGNEEESKPAKSKKPLVNATETNYNKADFELSASIIDGNLSNVSNSSNGGEYHQRSVLKIASWNVAGLRSWIKKDGLKYLEYEEPDIFCVQEIKCTLDQLPEEALKIPGYHPYWLCMPGGYAGVAIYSKIMPINVEYGIGNEEFDGAGRIITAEYEKFYLVNVYVPNSGRKLVNLEARMKWEKLFQAHVKKLDALKPVIIAGDMNVSHEEIDLANPKSNTRSAGFTIEERDKMTELIAVGFVDTFRHLYPDKRGAYTYWTYMANARSRNVGWRLDYFLVSERIVKRVVENAIRSQCKGSDHCPITLFINN